MAQKFDPMRVLEVFGSDPFSGQKLPKILKNFFTGQDHMHSMLGPVGPYVTKILTFWPVNF